MRLYWQRIKADIQAILWQKSGSDWIEIKCAGIFSFYPVQKYLIGTNGLRKMIKGRISTKN